MTRTNQLLSDGPLQDIDLDVLSDIQRDLVLRLQHVWVDFIDEMHATPIIAKIIRQTIDPEDYLLLLKDLRQQVIRGVNWITRAASSMDASASPLHAMIRKTFAKHATAEEGDFQLLESDFVACGGQRTDIIQGKMNIGSVALDAYIMHEASRSNPIHLLGTIFIIEGLGKIKAGQWGRMIQETLSLKDESVRFMVYHGEADQAHTSVIHQLIRTPLITPEFCDAMVRCAKTTAMLYANQYRMMGIY